MSNRTQGFTLLELVLVMAIAAILLVLAIPSYQSYVSKSRRAQATSALMDLQGKMEIFHANNGVYSNDLAAVGGAASDDHYDYAATVAEATRDRAFSLTATAKAGSPQSKDAEAGTSCATLTLDQDSGRGANALCWD